MHDPATILLAVCAVVVPILGFALRNQRRKAKLARKKFNDLEGEEQRMFRFLHDVGRAIEN